MRRIVGAGYGPGDEDRFLQLDVQFHLALARAAGNPTVERLMRMLFRELEIARDMAMHEPLVPEWTIAIHEETLAAVARRRSAGRRRGHGAPPRAAGDHVARGGWSIDLTTW